MPKTVSLPNSQSHSDRRIRRTRRLLGDALVSLILEKGYDEVSIEDITERADLGRTTFYLHYKDKGDLLLERIDQIAEVLITQVNNHLQREEYLDPTQWSAEAFFDDSPVKFLFQHAYENANFYRVILRGEVAARAAHHFRQIVNHYLETFFRKVLSPQPAIPPDVIANYFSGSLLALLTWWLENDMPYSVDEITLMFRKLFFLGCGWAIRSQ